MMEYEHLEQEIESQDLLFNGYSELGLNYEHDNLVNNELETASIENIKPSAQPPTGMLPCQDNFDGDFGFSILIDGLCQDKSWVYSDLLDCIYIRMHNVLIMQFKTQVPLSGPYYIRALLVYLNSDDATIPVNRCTNHAVEDDPTFQAHRDDSTCRCDEFKYVGHVMRSENGMYCYDPSSKRHSVITEVQKLEAGSESFAVPYKFCCKSSCPRGMQKRPVRIIFTLEDSNYQVLGRKVIQVRICSSPKRDMKRQEQDHLAKENKCPNGKRPMVLNEAPVPDKKIKLEPESPGDKEKTVQQLKDEFAVLSASVAKIQQLIDLLP